MTIPAEERQPYTDTPDNSGYQTRPTTMAALTAGLEGVLTRLARDPRKLILIIEAGPSAEGVRHAGCQPGVCLRRNSGSEQRLDGAGVRAVLSSALEVVRDDK